jgi:hypothetical protein
MSAFNLIAGAISAALGAKGASKSAAENQAGQEAAAKYAMEGSYPYDVAGSLGGAKFDKDGKVVGLGLSDPFDKQQKGFLTSAEANRGYLQGIEADPLTAENRYYDQQMALLAPGQEADREALDAQLVARGMLGSTGGMGQMQALRESQGTTNLQVRQSASDRVQDMIDRYRGRINEDVSGAAQLGQLPLDYAKLGVDTGRMLSDAAIMGSRYLSGAALTNANATAGRYGGFSNAINSFKGMGGRRDGYAWGTKANQAQYGGAGPTTAKQASYLSKNVYSRF